MYCVSITAVHVYPSTKMWQSERKLKKKLFASHFNLRYIVLNMKYYVRDTLHN